MVIRASCNSNKGKIRANNEDNYYFNGRYLPIDNNGEDNLLFEEVLSQDTPFYAIFDGIGGANYGEVASFAAASGCAEILEKIYELKVSGTELLSKLCFELNDRVNSSQEILLTSNMGSTAVGIYFNNELATVVNIGDSRGFLFRNSTLLQLTEDHAEEVSGFTPTGKKRKGALTQYLGINTREFLIEPSVREIRLEDGDAFLVCSDGLTDMVDEKVISSILEDSKDVRDAVSNLNKEAIESGGRDNITIIVCKINKE